MAHTEAFARLRRLAAMALWGARRGLRSPAAIEDAWTREVATREDATLSRRELLRAGGAAAALVASGCAPIGDANSEGSDTSAVVQPRIVIIGAGLAGLHCAYRLKERSVRATVYEAWNRNGGRIGSMSQNVPEGMVIELGGEFIDSDHKAMNALVKEFGLELEDRQAAAAGLRPVVFWAGGVEVPEATLVSQFTMLAPELEILGMSVVGDPKTFKELDALSLEKWLADNVPPALMPELHAVLTAAYRAEFGRETDEQSALNLLLLVDPSDPPALRLRGASDRRYHIKGGNDRLIHALVAALDFDQIVGDRQLVAVRDGPHGAFVLTFMSTVGAVEEVEADHVVFALPFSALRLCDLTAITLSDEKREIIAELGYGAHTRVMGIFSAPVWRGNHLASGATITDLAHQESWDSSLGQGGQRGILTALVGGDAGALAGMGTAESWFTSKALPGLEMVFPGAEAAYEADRAVRMHWPSAPFHKGSFTCYLRGQWAYHGRQGVREGNLHFCGEHCSLDYQGRMEGAAETGALVADEILGDLAMMGLEGL